MIFPKSENLTLELMFQCYRKEKKPENRQSHIFYHVVFVCVSHPLRNPGFNRIKTCEVSLNITLQDFLS